ncbi:uncharacterized protein STEHIDRAFT_109122 [Stereum hirsutum FP-91666 SS1]|uniref:uncharacterized protein n=1 Tax=Stereum hirsutum (strain FP-91666) TaxID=721885 RepID=UPI000440E217|nr:uncharacterized protein STEHIDRAFT_109122 [Stereum hirsutum FP-91666 SS1]EIM88780.1 hypothetical protein STEHIDRAFT_109122 [Stereum hirsutum FP-91666 SS1]
MPLSIPSAQLWEKDSTQLWERRLVGKTYVGYRNSNPSWTTFSDEDLPSPYRVVWSGSFTTMDIRRDRHGAATPQQSYESSSVKGFHEGAKFDVSSCALDSSPTLRSLFFSPKFSNIDDSSPVVHRGYGGARVRIVQKVVKQ